MPPTTPILVLDDERHVRSALGRVLRRMDFEPVEAESGEEGLRLLAERSFPCALVDLRMPGMGGMEFVRRARAQAPEMAQIVVTGHGDLQDARQCAQLGAADFLMKPWNTAELHLAILRALQSRGANRAAPGEPATARPDALKLVARVTDALRSERLPPRFAAPPFFAGARALAERGGARAALGATDAHLARRFQRIAAAELGTTLPLDEALARLGTTGAAAALALASAWRLHDGGPADRVDAIERLFRLARMRAAAMRTAAEILPASRVDPLRAHLTGLFADVGLVALTVELAALGLSHVEVERAAAEQHAAVGAWIAADWGLPGECVVACAQHHLALPLYRAEPLVLLLWACEEVAAAAAGTADVLPIPGGANAARLVGLGAGPRADLERACREAEARFARAQAGPEAAPAGGRRVA